MKGADLTDRIARALDVLDAHIRDDPAAGAHWWHARIVLQKAGARAAQGMPVRKVAMDYLEVVEANR